MKESSKKQNFLQGAALLALAVAIVKVIGAIYKIPLKHIIGDVGFSYFNTAYDIYTVLLTISTAGLPIAMSRMISQASSTGNYNQVRRVYKTARGIFLGLGIVSSALMMVFAHQLAAFQKQPDGSYLIACSADLDDMYDLFQVKGSCDAATVSGWVMEQVGRVPEVGDHFQAEGLDVTVTQVEHRRVLEIQVRVLEEPEEKESKSRDKREKENKSKESREK